MTDYTSPPPPPSSSWTAEPRQLRRSGNRVIAGVAGGVAEYLNLDPTPVRFAFVIALIVFLGGIGGPLLYLLAWAVLPDGR
jgi:phage shock protein C